MPMPALPVLNRRFSQETEYFRSAEAGYRLLPFRFISLDADRYVLSNFAGEHAVMPRAELQAFVGHQLPVGSPTYDALKSRHFLLDGDSSVALDLLAVKYRTKLDFLANSTSLFMFVVTLRCDHSCPYCQVSRQSADRHAFDMRREDALRGVEFMFQSPSSTIKVEFQGGESLMNFELIRFIVGVVEERNETAKKDVQFVVATNLAFLSDEILEFCGQHNIYFSTSLDGPRDLHNRNRPRPGGDSYEATVRGIERIREALGHDRVAALMTTTEASLERPREIVDEYARLGFRSIFLRSISPYGFAVRTGQADKYGIRRWLDFYKAGLARILELNFEGVEIREDFASIILRKVLTPFATGYVDLQSPAGLGISCLAFNYDGGIYASDEARMLAEMGDQTFRLGNLATDSFLDIMRSPALVEPIEQSLSECVPMCADCGFQPYCGSDPVQHHAVAGDFVGFKPTSAFCQKSMGIMRHLFRLLEDDEKAASVLRSWI